MHPAIVVVHVVERHGVSVVLGLLTVRVREPSETALRHSQRKILPLDVAGRNMIGIGKAEHGFHVAPDTLAGRVAALILFGRRAVNLLELCVIHFQTESAFNGL